MNILQEIQRASSNKNSTFAEPLDGRDRQIQHVSEKRDPIFVEHLAAIDLRWNEPLREEQMHAIGFQIEDTPTDYLLYFYRAILYLDCWSKGFSEECGDFDEPFEFDFEQDLETCLELNPSFADAYYIKATVVEQIHDDTEEARVLYLAAIEHDKRKFKSICNPIIKEIDRRQRLIERAERQSERELAHWQQSLG